MKATVTFKIQTSNTGFETSFGSQGEAEEQVSLLNAAIFGLLDVTLLFSAAPVSGFSVEILNAEIDDMSSPWAFRMAGRNAGEQLMRHLSNGDLLSTCFIQNRG